MLTDTQFVDIWQSSKSPKEIMEKTQLSRKAIYKRASRYRKSGIPLKYFRLRGDVTELAQRARDLENAIN